MPKPLELRKVIKILKKYSIIYVTGRGRHPKFYDPETHNPNVAKVEDAVDPRRQG